MNSLILGNTLLQHLRTEHLTHVEEITPDSYEKVSKEFGDHIIEFASEDSNEIIRVYSIL